MPVVIIRSNSDESASAMSLIEKATAKTLVEASKAMVFILRIENGAENTDTPIIIKGGIGILVPKAFEKTAKTIWKNEEISSLSESDFTKEAEKTESRLHLFGQYKGPAEPKKYFNGSPYPRFSADLGVLVADGSWHKLSKGQIQNGYNIPSQIGRPDAPWSCGPNSGARALQMLDRRVIDFNGFVKQCPKSFSFIWDIGPSPTQLANYLANTGTSFPPYPELSEHFQTTLNSIRWSIGNRRPMIVNLIRSFSSMHYVTVIGYSDAYKRVAIMDTTLEIYWMTYGELEWWMTAEGHILKLFIFENFNAIHF